MNRLLLLLLFALPQGMYAQLNHTQDAGHSPGKYTHVRQIRFKGNVITKPHIVLREMALHDGDSIVNEDVNYEVEYNKKRIMNLQLFSTVNYTINRFSADSIDIEYQLTELVYWLAKPVFSLADRNLNVWWFEQKHHLDRTNIGMEFTRANFRGRNEKIGGVVQLGYNKNFELFYSIPYIDKGLKHGLGANISYSTGREINFVTDSNKIYFFRSEHYPYQRFQAKMAYTYRNAYAAIHELNLSYNFFNISRQLYEMSPDFLGQKRRINYFELNYIFKYNNTDFRYYPINGVEIKTVLTKRGLGIDKDVNQFIAYTESSFYRTIYKKISWSSVFRGRLAFPQSQPYYFNRALGFKNEYVRGYEYFVVDGSHYAVLRNNIRMKFLDFVWTQNLIKFSRHVPVKLFGKIYDDLGYVHNEQPQNSFLNNRVLNGWGFGFDLLISYYARLRIEYSFNHIMQKSLFLHSTKE